jgi:isopentenyl diphosphate isomerase/L-lactate dehydrogenase-like FMN-dependent dehydrogenase
VTDGSSPITLADFEEIARARMDPHTFDYVAGGAGDELTLADNVAAFGRYRLLPRVLRDVSTVDSASTFLGAKVSMPIGVAPMAFQHYAHPDAEVAMASAAARAGALMCLSTLSSKSIEEVAQAADAAGAGLRCFQLYVHRERSRSEELVRRAEAAGYTALVLTADLPVAGNRERDVRNALQYPQVFGNFQTEATLGAGVGVFNDTSLSWNDVAWIRSLSSMPLVIKGILTAADAKLAAQHGASALIVSNHGGRQLDRTPASIDCLESVVDAVGSTLHVYVDGGVRRAVDVLTALAIGARGVFIGRPLFYALAANGEQGVASALAIIQQELRTAMALLGARSIGEITKEFVRQA